MKGKLDYNSTGKMNIYENSQNKDEELICNICQKQTLEKEKLEKH